MKDPHPYVRDTTAWTISRVFEFQHDAGDANVPELITRETLPQVAQVCCSCMRLPPSTCVVEADLVPLLLAPASVHTACLCCCQQLLWVGHTLSAPKLCVVSCVGNPTR